MKSNTSGRVRSIFVHLVLIFLSFLCLFFFYILIVNATRSHADLQKGFSALPGKYFLENLKNVANDGSFPMFRGILNSVVVSSCSAALCTYFSSLTAYGLYAYDFKMKKAAFTFIMAILVMPTQVTAMGFLRLITKMGMYDSLLPLIIPSIASPAVFYFMYSYLQSSLPLSLVEAARIDGSGEFRTFNSIVLPIMKPAVAVQAIFTFVGSWNNYFVPALIIQSKSKMTVPILIATLRGADYMNFDMGKIYMMITVAIIAKKRNYPTTREKFPPAKVVAKQALDSFWGLFFPFGIILGMRFGMFTPSEGGAVAVLYCFVIGKLVYKRLSFRKHFVPIVLDTIAGTSSVVLIMVSASVFGQYMTWINLPKIVPTAVLNLTSNKYAFLMLTNVILLIMGMFLEGGAALMIITPLLLPVARSLGIGVYHFGLVAIVNIMIGGITPPFGSMMFTTCGITKCPISDFLKEVWPFIVCLVLVLLLLTFCPTLINIVPDLIYGAEGGI